MGVARSDSVEELGGMFLIMFSISLSIRANASALHSNFYLQWSFTFAVQFTCFFLFFVLTAKNQKMPNIPVQLESQKVNILLQGESEKPWSWHEAIKSDWFISMYPDSLLMYGGRFTYMKGEKCPHEQGEIAG